MHEKLNEFLVQYNAADACMALCVSDLWLPNISSQVKHTLAFAVLASTPLERFDESSKLDTYERFQDFLQKVYDILPTFPMCEDFIPEQDWGEVKTECFGSFYRIFYGAAVERIPDFITAFNLHHSENNSALEKMHLALIVQDHMLKNISSKSAGEVNDIETGHIEIPSEQFWRECMQAISSLPDALSENAKLPIQAMKLGEQASFEDMLAFENAIMTGHALPGYLLEIDSFLIPMSLRNATGMVIQCWADKEEAASMEPVTPPAAVNDFLRQRVGRNKIVEGPFQIGNKQKLLPYKFAAALMGESPTFLLQISMHNTVVLTDLDRDLKEVLDAGEDWVVFQESSRNMMKIRNDAGKQPSFDDITILAVIDRVSTDNGMVSLPDSTARVFFLTDFISIIDSAEEAEELAHFWSYLDSSSNVFGFCGMVDQYAAFRDSYACLVEGAVQPDRIFIDPHWGSNWRFLYLKDFWINAPAQFPDRQWASWVPKRKDVGLYVLTNKQEPALSWCAEINGRSVHFVFKMTQQKLSMEEGSTLELVVNCLADVLALQRGMVAHLPLFDTQRITVECIARQNLGHKGDQNDLFSAWRVVRQDKNGIDVEVAVDLETAEKGFTKPQDASFEVQLVAEWLNGASKLLGTDFDESCKSSLMATANRQPRFVIHYFQKNADIPDFPSLVLPSPKQYKLARKKLAHVFKEGGAVEGRYELQDAKKIIDPARDAYRDHVHSEIAKFGKDALVEFCVEQIDALTGRFDFESARIKGSLSHEVSYDRSEEYAKEHGSYVKESKNYRYLLEYALSQENGGASDIAQDDARHLIAQIDWLLVLYTASDILHNGIDVAGLTLNHSFIPEIFYSEAKDEREKKYAEEAASLRMGVNVNEEDQVAPIGPQDDGWQSLEEAFLEDTGVHLRQILQGMSLLAHWPSVTGNSDFSLKYKAHKRTLIDVFCAHVEDLDKAQAEKLIDLITIDVLGVRRLFGKSTLEGDVPIWEHNKRAARYTLKPLISYENDMVLWGAAAVERSSRIWQSSFTNGYMPADFPWTNVKKVVGNIMEQLSKNLELKSLDVALRATPFAVRGIDFMRRYRGENFEDVGDYDVLAYWPDLNTWVFVECKYNQPVFCLKDARRLRERVFGRGEEKGQFAKIEKRRDFLRANASRLRELLVWPEPAKKPEVMHELYVAKDIHWWLRNPPYELPTEFLGIDVFESWLKKNKLLER